MTRKNLSEVIQGTEGIVKGQDTWPQGQRYNADMTVQGKEHYFQNKKNPFCKVWQRWQQWLNGDLVSFRSFGAKEKAQWNFFTALLNWLVGLL